MTRIKRRHFLQFAGSALAAVGLSQVELQRQSVRYGKVLAQDTPRKLALLVGINNYPNTERFGNLFGCVQDTELQKYLLMHRFGFQDSDILTITDQQASRQGILTAFKEHLIAQAKPGDVVVFHFSGHGSQVIDPNPLDANYPRNSTFVPSDDSSDAEAGIVNDITGQTLFLLMYALKQKTKNVTAVLDSCHSGGGTRGNITIRAVDGEGKQIGEKEREDQERLLTEVNLTASKLSELRRKGVATGVAIASARRNQLAADYKFSGFEAGAFTYLLTQSLWQQTRDVDETIDLVNRRLILLSLGQKAKSEAASASLQNQPVYLLQPQVAPAEAVVINTSGNKPQLWLGGVDDKAIEASGEGAVFVSSSNAKAKVISRNGLQADYEVIEGTVQPGELLQEYSRVIPADLALNIGLDPSLGADGEVAKEAIANLNRIKAIPHQTGVEPYPEDVQYILSSMTAAYQSQVEAEKMPPEGSIGLFSPTLEVVPDSFGEPGEGITEAIARLNSKFKSLLAARLISTTINGRSSRLDVGVTLQIEGGKEILGKAFTARGDCKEAGEYCSVSSGQRDSQEKNSIPLNEFFQLQIVNNEDNELYLGVILINPNGELFVLYPNEFSSLQEFDDEEYAKTANKIGAKETLLIPDPDKDSFVFVAEEPTVSEVLVIFSEVPMRNALLRLRSIARGRGTSKGVLDTRGDEAVDVISSLLQDFDRGRNPVQSRSEARPKEMATLSITYVAE
ncbi:MAG: caspase family protein [Spirulinaceae cyanobacterium]